MSESTSRTKPSRPNPSRLSPPSAGPAIESADIEWRDGQPVSRRFGDVYFSRDNGLEETRYVFLGHNQLDRRFANLGNGDSFVVAETGFGTGLNFLATWQAWRNHAPADANLHFVTAERFPLTHEDLTQALELWPELAPLSAELLDQYPALISGTHRLVFDGGRVRLTLYQGEALEAWQSLDFTADAWFLDGFAPALNPDLWVDRLIDAVATHSKPGTTVATFTAVGAVRRGLQAVGFEMRKTPGYGRKRDMLVGCFRPGDVVDHKASERPRAIVVGAGIAGALTARNLAERGYEVEVLAAGDGPGDAASGNPQAALYVKLGIDRTPETRLALAALLHAQRTYARYSPLAGDTEPFWHPTGLLQIAATEQEASRQSRFISRNHYPAEVLRPVTADEASQLSGVPIAHAGLWFPGSGWLAPRRVCQCLLDHPSIRCRFNATVETLAHDGEHWRVTTTDGFEAAAPQVVLAAGHRIESLLPGETGYRFKPIRGQVSQLPEQAFAAGPEVVVCGPSYLNPAHQGWAVTGATFDLRDANPAVSAVSHQENLDKLSQWLPDLWGHDAPAADQIRGRVAFRCTTHDYQPVAGAVGDQPDGLYVLTGLGSKGFALAPLLAEWLVDRMTAHPSCLEIDLSGRLNLARCWESNT
ncbi:bifunctional tRNA (5-methylaminomethyl-2-thiouridine)(34)-methyltransferase MnmD/FAD-dependent 5-carboxymethylaminomethyl-2-thiouridine(34) oxidoreductase MnmC [Marinobacter bohaiensis]|uniref:bifunctional tRNA (5-methylaminomethyl-2-thiouridine)(34)-methyltransferase MnmD/FAD-dependent 5-carboxymethylaminomethyl-2-thiouridine(34) oxidoreductase MnmC n=1 Tax=Marinobacter bohaiensis TaxID=2201898 RepID=UPI000DAD9AA2|nr:bifunctional tRNA (5-methylaminomethyl-2-thiouridine)(34)-methyltransferase MnmD/FAD-dependent 5-carboxymethylaminomethyl-2-thiouridine(34) oxidoreductase MnmC [Marinobacter bohaiensis]